MAHLELLSSGNTAGHKEAVWDMSAGKAKRGSTPPGRLLCCLVGLFPGLSLLLLEELGEGGSSPTSVGQRGATEGAGIDEATGSDHRQGVGSPRHPILPQEPQERSLAKTVLSLERQHL